jgi:5'-3' exonuclease
MWMFYYQLLVGDSADNIKGCKGIGKVKANRAIEVGMTEWDMFEIVRELYGNDEELLMNAQVLKIQQQTGELWQFPQQQTIELEPEVLSGFTVQMQG